MAKKAVANRHLVCYDYSCWIQFDTSGCTIPWAEMKGSTVFKCKGCTEVARLVGEVEDLRGRSQLSTFMKAYREYDF